MTQVLPAAMRDPVVRGLGQSSRGPTLMEGDEYVDKDGFKVSKYTYVEPKLRIAVPDLSAIEHRVVCQMERKINAGTSQPGSLFASGGQIDSVEGLMRSKLYEGSVLKDTRLDPSKTLTGRKATSRLFGGGGYMMTARAMTELFENMGKTLVDNWVNQYLNRAKPEADPDAFIPLPDGGAIPVQQPDEVARAIKVALTQKVPQAVWRTFEQKKHYEADRAAGVPHDAMPLGLYMHNGVTWSMYFSEVTGNLHVTGDHTGNGVLMHNARKPGSDFTPGYPLDVAHHRAKYLGLVPTT